MYQRLVGIKLTGVDSNWLDNTCASDIHSIKATMKYILKQYVSSSACGQTLITHFVCITFYMIYKFEVLT